MATPHCFNGMQTFAWHQSALADNQGQLFSQLGEDTLTKQPLYHLNG
jgi:hypothetical protein